MRPPSRPLRLSSQTGLQCLTILLFWIVAPIFAAPQLQYRQPSLANSNTALPDLPSLPEGVINATEFEASNRAHGHAYNDPFYSVPNGTETVAPGTLLKIENITNTSLYTIPPSLSLSRFMYQSATSQNESVPASGYILWPYIARQRKDSKIPWIAYAHGTSGISADCAPSNIRNLWQHFQAPFQLALQGYAVVAPDYAGLGIQKDAAGNFITHEYIVGPAQANDVWYAITAIKATVPQFSEDFVIMGHSQGGQAAWATAQKLNSEPIPGHVGTVAVAPVTRVLDFPPNFGIINVVALLLVPTISKLDQSFDPNTVLTAQGMQVLQNYLDLEGCSSVLGELTNGTGITRDGWQNLTTYQDYQDLAEVGRQGFHGPLLVIQGLGDKTVDPQVTIQAVDDTAAMFPSSTIEMHPLPDVDHVPSLHAGQLIWERWIEARFAGEKLPAGFRNVTAKPVRPMAAQQGEVNWYLALEQGPYQET